MSFVVEVIANFGIYGVKFLKGLLSAKALHWQCQSKTAWCRQRRSLASSDENSILLFQNIA